MAKLHRQKNSDKKKILSRSPAKGGTTKISKNLPFYSQSIFRSSKRGKLFKNIGSKRKRRKNPSGPKVWGSLTTRGKREFSPSGKTPKGQHIFKKQRASAKPDIRTKENKIKKKKKRMASSMRVDKKQGKNKRLSFGLKSRFLSKKKQRPEEVVIDLKSLTATKSLLSRAGKNKDEIIQVTSNLKKKLKTINPVNQKLLFKKLKKQKLLQANFKRKPSEIMRGSKKSLGRLSSRMTKTTLNLLSTTLIEERDSPCSKKKKKRSSFRDKKPIETELLGINRLMKKFKNRQRGSLNPKKSKNSKLHPKINISKFVKDSVYQSPLNIEKVRNEDIPVFKREKRINGGKRAGSARRAKENKEYKETREQKHPKTRREAKNLYEEPIFDLNSTKNFKNRIFKNSVLLKKLANVIDRKNIVDHSSDSLIQSQNSSTPEISRIDLTDPNCDEEFGHLDLTPSPQTFRKAKRSKAAEVKAAILKIELFWVKYKKEEKVQRKTAGSLIRKSLEARHDIEEPVCIKSTPPKQEQDRDLSGDASGASFRFKEIPEMNFSSRTLLKIDTQPSRDKSSELRNELESILQPQDLDSKIKNFEQKQLREWENFMSKVDRAQIKLKGDKSTEKKVKELKRRGQLSMKILKGEYKKKSNSTSKSKISKEKKSYNKKKKFSL